MDAAASMGGAAGRAEQLVRAAAERVGYAQAQSFAQLEEAATRVREARLAWRAASIIDSKCRGLPLPADPPARREAAAELFLHYAHLHVADGAFPAACGAGAACSAVSRARGAERTGSADGEARVSRAASGARGGGLGRAPSVARSFGRVDSEEHSRLAHASKLVRLRKARAAAPRPRAAVGKQTRARAPGASAERGAGRGAQWRGDFDWPESQWVLGPAELRNLAEQHFALESRPAPRSAALRPPSGCVCVCGCEREREREGERERGLRTAGARTLTRVAAGARQGGREAGGGAGGAVFVAAAA